MVKKNTKKTFKLTFPLVTWAKRGFNRRLCDIK